MTDFALGIDLGGSKIKSGLVDREGRVLEFHSLATQKGKQPELVLTQIKELILWFENRIGKDDHLLGVGLAVPGSIDRSAGVCLTSPNLGWENVDLVGYLQNYSNLKIKLINDANAACLGEFFYGTARGSSYSCCITLGTGLGTAFILNGRLFLGPSGCAGEGGHMVIRPNGAVCSCGRKGCWETLVSGTAIVNRTLEKISNQRAESGSIGLAISELSAGDVVKAARSGNCLAIEVLAEVSEDLVLGLANLINIFNPQMIVLTGGVAEAGETLFYQLEQRVKQKVFAAFREDLQIKLSELGNKSGVLGAASLWFKQIKTIGG